MVKSPVRGEGRQATWAIVQLHLDWGMPGEGIQHTYVLRCH